jgi:hypothetical protein
MARIPKTRTRTPPWWRETSRSTHSAGSAWCSLRQPRSGGCPSRKRLAGQATGNPYVAPRPLTGRVRRLAPVEAHRRSDREKDATIWLVLRHVDPWTVMKCSALAYLSLCLMGLVAASVLWNVARVVGVLGSIQRLIGQLSSSPGLRLRGANILAASCFVGGLFALLGAALNGVSAVLFNLTLDVVGGIDLGVADGAARPKRARRRRTPASAQQRSMSERT